MSSTHISDMTLDELIALIDKRVHIEMTEVLQEHLGMSHPKENLTLDDFPVDDLGPWPEGLTLRREEMYSDDGR
jgi:hypothetical protein